ncbi:hypothetical protein CHS0354_022274 [Potamilus streckersoni]|uniref:Uncharacterized protein n=1 Tax=Potamilus streckersoni TaxID=2493646 RepID=A0AAE0TGZ0_9BIVA|nr:hypothetical protein CHS0354_022274 [Potamilus streckersoni]
MKALSKRRSMVEFLQAKSTVNAHNHSAPVRVLGTRVFVFLSYAFPDQAEKGISDRVVKEAMMIIANTVLKDEKYGNDVIATLSDVQLGASVLRWLDECQLCPVTWSISWNGTWRGAGGLAYSATSSWTAVVQRSRLCLSGWYLKISPQQKNS